MLARTRFPPILLPMVGLLLLSIPILGCYLWVSQATYGLGFPLDDAWIHQTYARNLAQLGEWSFLPGKGSAGSTAPLWTALLSLGHILKLEPTITAYGLGWVTLITIALLVGYSARIEIENPRWIRGALALLVLMEWHLAWAALSGMETLLLALHSLVILWALDRGWNPGLIGAVAGVGLWIRPDALLVAIPIAWVFLCRYPGLKGLSIVTFKFLGGFASFALPYLAFNVVLGGELWPSTFYAKQFEYAVTREAGFLSRLFTVAKTPFVGSGLLLLPGMLVAVAKMLRDRKWSRLAGFFWIISFLIVYAWRLPVDYQHGRYIMPVIPALFLLGMDGMLGWLLTPSPSLATRIVKRSWVLSLSAVTLLFWLRGAQAYAQDVAIIETEMVASARWINLNTKQADVIAAHDIGALGYFADRQVLDLAGLISPEVIPIIRDEQALEVFVTAHRVAYLMTFPGWYPALTRGQEIVFSTDSPYSPAAGGENMAIYRWR